MKKRICFAGFRDAEVETLQPEVATINAVWDCVFVKDGTAALEELKKAPCAALVADLRMEGMSGVGLLQLIAADFPTTLRFALGDVMDREAVVTNIGAPHQFISRPWKLVELAILIERSMALDAWLSSDKLRKFVPKLGRLPGLPSTYFEVLKCAESPNASVEEIGQIISRDPALTARVLQTVNSAAVAMGEKITNPVEAVSVLGLDTIKSLVLCLQVFSQSPPSLPTGITLDDLWRHSFAVGQLSRKIALLHTSDARIASDAFTAGLLHRVGQIVLTTNLAKEYAEVVSVSREENRLLHEVEKLRLGVTSSQIGAYLLGLWGMPLTLIEADALYNEPDWVTAREFTLLTAVHVADVIAQEDRPLAERVPQPKLNREYMKALKLPEKTEAWRKALAGGQFSEAAKAEEEESARPPKPKSSSQLFNKSNGSSKSSPALMWAVVAILVAAAGFFGWKQFAAKKATTDAPVSPVTANANTTPDTKSDATTTPATSTQPAEPAETQEEAQAIAAAFDGLTIKSIIYSPNHPVALINGKACTPGDKVNGITVTAITQSNVLLTYKSHQKSLALAK